MADRNCRQRRGFRVGYRRPVEYPEPSGVMFEVLRNRSLRGERGRSNYQFLASFSGRPQQHGLLFNRKNTGNVSDPFGLLSAGLLLMEGLLPTIPAFYASEIRQPARRLHAMRLTSRTLPLQSPKSSSVRRSSPTRFVRRYFAPSSSNSSALADQP